MHMKQSPYQLHPQQFLSSSSSFYIMLYYAVFQALKRKLTLRNMNGSLYCCYQNSPLPSHSCLHVQELHTHTHTHKHTHTHTHTNVYYYKNVLIILMFTYEIKSTRGLAN